MKQVILLMTLVCVSIAVFASTSFENEEEFDIDDEEFKEFV